MKNNAKKKVIKLSNKEVSFMVMFDDQNQKI